MKIKYFFYILVIATVVANLTSCSDNNDGPENPTDASELVIAPVRVKVGADNRVPLPIISGAGDYHAFSLAPDVADVVVDESGQIYIEGFRNGKAGIIVSDASTKYEHITVNVYTTDQMQLSHDEYNFVVTLGQTKSSDECYVVVGNGEYSVSSDNPKVEATIDSETGLISLTATAGIEEYTATVTVADVSGLTADLNVVVSPSFDPFTQEELDELTSATDNKWYIKSSKFTWTINRDLPRYEDDGEWTDSDNDNGTHTFGWWENYYGNDYGGHYIIYPTNTAIDQTVSAQYHFKYYYSSWGSYELYELDGNAKIIKDDAQSKVVIWWNVDMENECIERGYIVYVK